MKIIAIESTGGVAGVAYAVDGRIVGTYSIDHQKTHSQTLLPMLDALLSMAEVNTEEIDVIAVSAGPGSYTGLRIGTALAKGLAEGWQKPLLSVPTLEGLAYCYAGDTRLICPLMDARRGQVYSGIYRFTQALEYVYEGEATLLATQLARLNERGEAVVFLGDGVDVHAETIVKELRVPYVFAPTQRRYQSAACVAAWAADVLARGAVPMDAADFAPMYLRKSQAEQERQLCFRAMTASDLDAVAALEADSFSRPWQRADFANALEKQHYLYYVALDGDVLCGMAGLIISSDEADISNVAVAADYRVRGVATALLRTLLQAGRERGIRSFTLEVRAGNTAAIRLYEKLGFAREGVRRNFYAAPTEDALIYWLRET